MTKYPVLASISAILRFVGWLAVWIGGLTILWGLYDVFNSLSQVNGPNYYNGFGTAALAGFALIRGLAKIGGGAGLVLLGLLFDLVGEIARVLIDIENNTAQSAEALIDIEDNTAQTLSVLRNAGVQTVARPAAAGSSRSPNPKPVTESTPCSHNWGEARLQPDGRWSEVCAVCGTAREAP